MDVHAVFAVRNDRFGEFLLTIPAFKALKRLYPNALLIAAVNPSVVELAGRIRCIDEIIPWEKRSHSLAQILRLRRMLKERRVDVCVIFNPDKEFNMISFLSGIKKRLGYDRKWGFLLTHRVKDTKFLAAKHEIEYNLELLSCLGASMEDTTLDLAIDQAMVTSILRKYGFSTDARLVALHPWTSDSLKQWPLDRFRELAKMLSLRANVFIVGGKEEIEKSKALSFEAIPGVIDLTGKTTLVELAALLKAATLLISGDSGPVHLACCVKTPALALFRNDIIGKGPQRWGPWGENASVLQKPCLADITVDEVYRRSLQMLNEIQPSP